MKERTTIKHEQQTRQRNKILPGDSLYRQYRNTPDCISDFIITTFTRFVFTTPSYKQMGAAVCDDNGRWYIKRFLRRPLVFAIVFVIANLLLHITANATNYYSAGNNAPNLTASWWTSTNGTGSHPTNFTTGGNIFIIQAGHTMTTTATWTVSGAGSSVLIYGTLVASNTVTIPSGSVIESGGTYRHNINGGNIPTATWDAASTCLITGATSTAPGGYNQAFGNFTWNCNQTTYLSLGGAGSSNATTSILGNLTVMATGNSPFDFAIDGNITVSKDLIISGGIFRVCYNNVTPNRTQNISGNVSITGGTLLMNSSSSNNSSGILNVAGNFTIAAGGTINESTSATNSNSTIVFNGSGTQTFTSGGTISNTIDFTVNSGATLQMASSTTTITGGGTFTLSAGATIGITSTAGITSAGSSGNIQTTSRSFSTGANYIYNGTGGAQDAGNGLPATVSSLTISNTAGVTLLSAIAVTNGLSITSGSSLNLGSFTHTAGSLTLGGVGKAGDSWGSSASPAVHKNDTYFAVAGTGIVNVTNSLCATITTLFTQTNLACFQSSSGGITITPNGGTAPYTYSIDNGASYVNNGGTFSGLSAGTYKIRVMDNNGCESKPVQ